MIRIGGVITEDTPTNERLENELKYYTLSSKKTNPNVLLAERTESLISRENAKWVSTQEQVTQ